MKIGREKSFQVYLIQDETEDDDSLPAAASSSNQ